MQDERCMHMLDIINLSNNVDDPEANLKNILTLGRIGYGTLLGHSSHNPELWLVTHLGSRLRLTQPQVDEAITQILNIRLEASGLGPDETYLQQRFDVGEYLCCHTAFQDLA